MSRQIASLHTTTSDHDRVYWSGEVAPRGTYLSLSDGRLVRMRLVGPLPTASAYRESYMRVSGSPTDVECVRWVDQYAGDVAA